MKKIISLIIAIVMLSTTVFADAASEFLTAWEKTAKITSLKGKITLSTSLNRPLEIFETFPKEVLDESGIDFKMFTESIIGSVTEIEYQYSCSDDYKKMDMEFTISCNSPVVFNEDLKVETWSRFWIGMTYDVTDINNPVYKLIMKVPFEKKYQVFDLSDAIHPEVVKTMSQSIDASFKMQKDIMDTFLKYAQVTKSRNEYTVKMDEKSIKEYLKEAVAIYKEHLFQNGSAQQLDTEEIDEVINVINNNLDNISFLGKDGLTLKATVNSQGIISTQVEKMNICLNVYDILEINGLSTKDLPREKAFIDITYSMDMSTEGFNKTTVNLPELTPENSDVVYTAYETQWYYDAKEPPVFKNGSIYYPLDSMADQLGYDLEIKKDGETISVTFEDGVTVSASGNLFTTQIGEELETEVPYIICENEKFYCVEDVLYWMHIYSVSMRYDKNKNEFVISYEVTIPEEDDEVTLEGLEEMFDSEYDDSEYEYIPYYLDFYISEETSPYMEDGVLYMPVEGFFAEIIGGEGVGDDNSLTVTSTEENVFDINTVTVTNGDSTIVINGENRQLSNPARLVDGVMRIPLTFAMDLGLEGRVRGDWYEDNVMYWSYSFDMINPEYEEKYESNYEPKNLGIFFGSDQIPYMENGELYVPAYELFTQMYSGEWTFSENGMEYTTSEENSIKIKKMSAYVGDNFVTVDDKKVEFENKIINVDGVIRVPISFTEKLGMEMISVTCEYDRAYYRFVMPNPSYVEPVENPEEGEEENWLTELFYW